MHIGLVLPESHHPWSFAPIENPGGETLWDQLEGIHYEHLFLDGPKKCTNPMKDDIHRGSCIKRGDRTPGSSMTW